MIPSSATVEASASTLSGASVETMEGNDFMNVGRDIDMFKFENVSHLIINNHCATGDGASEVREDASSGSIATVFVTLTALLGGIFGSKPSETDPVSSGNIPQQSMPDYDARDHSEPRATVTEIQDIMASAPLSVLDAFDSTVSPLTQSSSSERYIRSMLECNQGYPLYEPEPESQEGVRVGDVGLITDDGGFDFLFNVCPPPTNPDELPDNFEMLRSPEILVRTHFQSETRLFSKGVKRTGEPDVKYTCSGPEGGVLELPLGATRFEAKNKASFKRLATRHAENWYRYTVLTKERDAPNGSLYIVTSCIKCTDFGIAVFDRPSDPQDYLRLITNETRQSKYRWQGSGAYMAKVAPNPYSADSNADSPNQCVFLRGYKILLPEDIWNNITNFQSTGTSSVAVSPSQPRSGNKSESPRQGDSSNQDDPSQSRANNSPGSDCQTTRAAQNTRSRTDTSARVILYEYSKTSPAHPSDLINAILLCQEPKAKVALTHDDDWCDLLRYHSQIPNFEALAKVGLPYTSNVDEYGCASLKRSDLNPNVTVVESSSDTRVTPTSENRLPIDNTRTIPTHKLPSMGDDLALVQEDHPHPFNATTQSSTPHSQTNYLPVLLVSVTDANIILDDTSVSTLPRGQVDYLSRNWQEEDVWRSWRQMTRQKNEITNNIRLENAIRRAWWTQKNKLKIVTPETLNWLKDPDVTWLYEPLHTPTDWTPPIKPKTDNHEFTLDGTNQLRHKPILKYRSISEMLTSELPSSPVFSQGDLESEETQPQADAQAASDVPVPDCQATSSKSAWPALLHTKNDTHITRWDPNRAFRKDSSATTDGIAPSQNESGNDDYASQVRSSNSQGSSSTGARTTGLADRRSSNPNQKKRHIHFNTFVEQCIYDDGYEEDEDNADDDDEVWHDCTRRPPLSRSAIAGSDEDEDEESEEGIDDDDPVEIRSSSYSLLKSTPSGPPLASASMSPSSSSRSTSTSSASCSVSTSSSSQIEHSIPPSTSGNFSRVFSTSANSGKLRRAW